MSVRKYLKAKKACNCNNDIEYATDSGCMQCDQSSGPNKVVHQATNTCVERCDTNIDKYLDLKTMTCKPMGIYQYIDSTGNVQHCQDQPTRIGPFDQSTGKCKCLIPVKLNK